MRTRNTLTTSAASRAGRRRAVPGAAAVLGIAFAGLAAAGPKAGGGGAFKVVAHPAVTTASLTRAALSSAFMKKTERWPDGTPIVPVDQAHDSPLRHAFSREILDRSVANVDAFWQQQVFSGRATPPITKPGDAEVIAYVRSVPGAVGYVSAAADSGGLKEIRLE